MSAPSAEVFADNETFGPLVSIYPVTDEDEAVDAPFGLPPTLWQMSLLPIVRTVMKLPGRN